METSLTRVGATKAPYLPGILPTAGQRPYPPGRHSHRREFALLAPTIIASLDGVIRPPDAGRMYWDLNVDGTWVKVSGRRVCHRITAAALAAIADRPEPDTFRQWLHSMLGREWRVKIIKDSWPR